MSSPQCNDFFGIEYVFLDRDGVLNRPPVAGQFVTRCEELALLPGVAEAVAELNRSGRKVIVVTNQRGVALGLYSKHELDRIHEELRRRLGLHGSHLDAIYVCPHDAGQCSCRKPLTGMFEQAFRDFPGAEAGNSVVVGDALCDIEAGVRLGMRTAFVCDPSSPLTPEAERGVALATVRVHSLAEFVNRSLRRL